MAELPPVLVVDDDPCIRDLIKMVFEDERYMVAEAPNGREALDFLARYPGRYLITLGLRMPVLGGRGFMEELEAQPGARAQHKIVVISGAASILKDHPLDVDAVLLKPFMVEELLDTIDTIGRSWER